MKLQKRFSWCAMDVTIKDVARYCGVSVSTVSRCLNGYTDISEETVKKVCEAVALLDYVPNNAARQMTKKNTKIIGLTIPDIRDPFFAANASGAEKLLEENGYQLFYGNMERSADKVVAFLHKAREMRFDGLIITPDAWTDTLLDALKKVNVPIVSLRRRPPQSAGVPFVDNDHYKGALEMLNYLAELGHTRIAHIVLPTQIGAIRREAYLDFCRIRSAEPRLGEISLPANKLSDALRNGQEAMKSILERYPDTTAVFAATDQLAIGALAEMKRRGLSAPDDISVSGIGDMEYSALPWIDLTTMSLDKTEMGRCAAQMLLDMIEGRDRHPESMYLGSSLIVRSSTREYPSPRAAVHQK